MRAATTQEKTYLRTRPQSVRVRLAALEDPPVVFAAQVNQASFGTTTKPYDMIAQATFDNVTTGVYTDVIPGMTMLIGSTSGAHDLGQVRVRKAFTSTIAYFGETSSIAWANDIFITVIDEMLIWPKHVRVVAQVPYMDYETAYSDQHSIINPVVCMGSDLVVDTKTYPVTISLSSALSHVIGSTISGHAWTASAGSLADANTSTPDLTISSYPANGRIRLKCTVTAANGKTSDGYRYVYVYDSTHRPHEGDFLLESCEGNYDDGGWTFDLSMLDNALLTNVRDRAKVILYAEDLYGKTSAGKLSMGQLAGSENIIATGWINGQTIEWNSEASVVSFAVEGAHLWLDRMPGFPPGVEIKKGSMAAAWTNFPSLTVDKALFHLLYWRSTAATVMDIFLSDDTRLASAFEVPTGSIWSQIVEIAETSILAHPCCNRYNQLFVEVDANLVPEADRTWASVMEIEKGDWMEQISLPYSGDVNQVSMLDASGVAVNSSGKGTPYFSLANGHIFSHYGDIEIADRLLLSDQDTTNELAGLAFGKRNNPYPDWEIELWSNNRMIDIAPRSFLPIVVEAADTTRGIEYNGNLIPRTVSHEHDPEKGTFTTGLNLESETFEDIAITGDRPSESSIPTVDDPPVIDDPPPIEDGDLPEDGVPYALIATQDQGFLYTENANEDDVIWNLMNGGLTTDQYAGNGSNPRIKQVIRTPSGAIFVTVLDYSDQAYDSDARGATHLFYAAGLGGVWTELLYAGDIAGVSDPNTEKPRIVCIAADPTVSEHIIVVGGIPGVMRVLSGDRNGLTEVAASLDSRRRLGSAVLNSAKWMIVHAEDNVTSSRAWSRLTAAYTIEVNTSNDFGTLGSAADRDHWAILCGDKVAYWTHGSELAFIVSNFPTNITSAYTGLAADSTFPVLQCYLAASPDGTRLMGGGRSVIGQRSSDGGASFGNVGTGGGFGIGRAVWANCGDNLQWMAATAQNVMRTLDFGDNWEDISGNLPTIAPLCGITHLLAFG